MYQPTSFTISKKQTIISSLEKVLLKGGPEPHEYKFVNNLMDGLQDLIDKKIISKEDIVQMRKQCSFLDSTNSILGHILHKPYGYAGDFDIIDQIYLNNPTNKATSKWDKYALDNDAGIAVRNRKKYFKQLILDKVKSDQKLEVCDVASGPARDVKELYDLLQDKKSVNTTCVDLDQQAIQFAKKLTQDYKEQINFVHKNILRFSTDTKFDVVWSAGLFDYFDDKVFVRLLNRFTQWIKPGGEVVIGNFNEEHNPTRSGMELFGDWYLNHRTPAQLRHLAILAGAQPEQITIDQEEEGINLFLRIQC